MSAAPVVQVPHLPAGRPFEGECTLLDLVHSVSEVTSDEREIVATVVHLLRSGRVRLCGNFRGQRLDLA